MLREIAFHGGWWPSGKAAARTTITLSKHFEIGKETELSCVRDTDGASTGLQEKRW